MQSSMIIGGGIVGAVLVAVAIIWSLRHRRQKAKLHGNANTTKLASTLQNERTRGDIILSAIEDGVVFVDAEGTIRSFNPGAEHITGWARQDAEGLNWKSVFLFIDSKGVPVAEDDTPFMKAQHTAQTVRDNTANLKTKSDLTIAANFSVSPLISDANVSGLVGIFRDVSEERQAEAQRAEFISTASHEMRTPVAAIEGYLSLALNENVATVDARARDYLQKAHASTKHLGELFQDLLTSAKAEDGRLINHPEVVEMGAFMEQLTSDLRFAAEKKDLGIDFVIGSNNVIDASAPATLGGNRVIRPLYYVLVDPDRLREVLTNLFDNACKYTDRGKVSLGLTGNDSVVQLYVRDTGQGIPPEDITHLFQKFYRVDNSTTRTIGGTGLGLFISRKIIEMYHGRIWVESTLGEGSVFYINLPRLTATEAEEKLANQANSVQNSAAPATAPAAKLPAEAAPVLATIPTATAP